MGLFPIVMNIIQFWLIDSIVKFQSTFVDIPGPSDDPEDQRPLFNDHSSEDGDDGGEYTHQDSSDVENGDVRSRTSAHPSPIIPGSRSAPIEDPSGISSTPTSTSSRTITIKRRSPPPSPRRNGSGSSSYGSTDAPIRSPPSWMSRTESQDEHTKWGMSFGSGAVGVVHDITGDVTLLGDDTTADKERRPSLKSINSTKKESWKMPVIVSPPSNAWASST